MSFTYNGHSCEEFDLYVERYPARVIPKKKLNEYNVAGRSGKVFIPQGGYENVLQTYEVFIKGGSTLQNKASLIASWLLTPDEPKDLTDTYDSTARRRAMFIGGNDWSNSLNKFGRATLTFDCAPQRYDAVPTTYTGTVADGQTGGPSIGDGTSFGNGYVDEMNPLIRMWSSNWAYPNGCIVGLRIENMITHETTTVQFESTTSLSDYEIVVDTEDGVAYLKHRSTGLIVNVTDYFDVTITGNLQMKFTTYLDITISAGSIDVKYNIDPRKYKL